MLYFTMFSQHSLFFFFFFFNDPAPPEIYPLPLPDALPICSSSRAPRCSIAVSRGARTAAGPAPAASRADFGATSGACPGHAASAAATSVNEGIRSDQKKARAGGPCVAERRRRAVTPPPPASRPAAASDP